jgi:hypothetical protein
VFSRFSGGFRGYILLAIVLVQHRSMQDCSYRFRQEEVVIFRLDAEIFEYRVRPEPLHVILVTG